MPLSHSALLLAAFSVSTAAFAAQAPAGDQQTAPAAQATLSGLLQPSIDGLQQTMQSLRLDKWKGGGVRSEAERNISSIMSDLQTTLPPMIQAADASPATVSKALPVVRNVDALYDVVLRVFDAARVAAPSEQVAQLQQAMTNLENARRGVGERIDAAAAAQEKQIADLEGKLRAQVVPVCPVQPAPAVKNCPATTAKKAVRRRPKPAAKTPPANAPANPPASQQKPSN